MLDVLLALLQLLLFGLGHSVGATADVRSPTARANLQRATANAPKVPLPRFSWDTLPVFLHTQNTTCGDWNPAAAARAAQYPLSYSGMTGMRQSNGSMISQEIAAPAVCRRITALNR